MLVLFTDLLDDIRLAIKNIKERLDKKKNTVYTKTGSATRVSGQYVTLCTISGLPVGKYLVLANTQASISRSDLTIVSILECNAKCDLYYGLMRGTMSAGGGVSGFGLLTVNSAGGSVTLQSYGSSPSYTLYGNLLAIRLVD